MSLNGGILEFDFDDDDYEESYYDDDYEESSIFGKPKRKFFAKRPPPYYRPGPGKRGTITPPGGNPVPVNFGDKFATAGQMQSSLSKVQNDILALAEAVKKLEVSYKSASGGMNPAMFMLMQPKPSQIQSIKFSSDPNVDDAFEGKEIPVATTTYKEEKSNLGLMLMLSMMQGGNQGGNDMNQMLMLLIATQGGL